MSEVIIIVGLPGSGKTTYAKDFPTPGFTLFDDAAASKEGMAALQEHIRSGGNVIMTDVFIVVGVEQ